MESEKRLITIELLTEMLGTVPKDPEVYKTHILSKSDEILGTNKAEEEIETVEDVEEKGWTGFHADGDGIFIYDYMIRGFIKAALESCMKNGSVPKIVAYKKWVDRMVFVWPRRVRFMGKTEPDDIIERAIRIVTAQGPRTALMRSDIVEEGTRLQFEVELLKMVATPPQKKKKEDTETPKKKAPAGVLTWDILDEIFAYGRYVGLGQWRGSGGYGRFMVVDSEYLVLYSAAHFCNGKVLFSMARVQFGNVKSCHG